MMHATRRVLSSGSTNRNKDMLDFVNGAIQAMKVPQRGTLELLSSASKGCISLLNQSSRDEFVNYCNKDIINPERLGQAKMGFLLTLALYHDLKSPFFQKYKCDIGEVLNGIKPALERYHDVINMLSKQRLEKFREMKSSNGSIILEPEWRHTAQNDPDSLEAQLFRMSTPELADMIDVGLYIDFKTMPLSTLDHDWGEGDTEINNLNLLSARAVEIIPQSQIEKSDTSQNEEPPLLEDDSLTDIGLEKDYPVVAQIEVSYHCSKLFALNFKGGYMISTLEAYLHGDPDSPGRDMVRWKMVA